MLRRIAEEGERMRRLRVAAVLCMVAIPLATAPSAVAAEPNNQAWLGEDFSSYARFGTSGGFVSFDCND
jgi:hypothetical protein